MEVAGLSLEVDEDALDLSLEEEAFLGPIVLGWSERVLGLS